MINHCRVMQLDGGARGWLGGLGELQEPRRGQVHANTSCPGTWRRSQEAKSEHSVGSGAPTPQRGPHLGTAGKAAGQGFGNKHLGGA